MGDIELRDILSPEEKHASTSRLFEDYFFEGREQTPINPELRIEFYKNLEIDDQFKMFIKNTARGEEGMKLFDNDRLGGIFQYYFFPPPERENDGFSFHSDEHFYGTNFKDGIVAFITSNFKVKNEEKINELWDILDRVLKETIRRSRGGKSRRTNSNKRRKSSNKKGKSRKSRKTKRRRH